MQIESKSVGADRSRVTRRDLFRQLFGGLLAGGTILESGFYRAALARAMAPTATDGKLFDIVKVADGVFRAEARPQAFVESSSVIFVNSKDVLVVDSQRTPSASASLVRQIQNEITLKPVRYVVNTHFHDDHTQGNAAYKAQRGPVDFIATGETRKLVEEETLPRLKATIDSSIPAMISKVRGLKDQAKSDAERAFCDEMVRYYEAFAAEMKNFSPVLPTITFDKTYVIKDREHDLHIEFHGPAHTAGDCIVFCPQKRLVATGDMILDQIPYMPDAYPRFWPKTIDSVGRLEFDRLLPAHGPIHTNRDWITWERNYLEELVMRVEAGKRAGKTAQELQAGITMDTMKSLKANDYGKKMEANRLNIFPHWGDIVLGPPQDFQRSIDSNTRVVYRNLDRGVGTVDYPHV